MKRFIALSATLLAADALADVVVTGTLTTSAPGDTYPIVREDRVKGGVRTVANQAARDAIPAEQRSTGMMVKYAGDNSGFYSLGSDLTTWTLVTFGGSLNLFDSTDFLVTTSGGTNTIELKPGMTLASGSLTASAPAEIISQTWNQSGVNFSAFDVNVTLTLADSNLSALQRWNLNGSPIVEIKNYGVQSYHSVYASASDTVGWGGLSGGRSKMRSPADGEITMMNYAATSFAGLTLGPAGSDNYPKLVPLGSLGGLRINGGANGSVGFFQLPEMASAPSSPAVGSWNVYAASGGVYIKKFDGTIVGPLGSGGSGGAVVVTNTISSGLYPSDATAASHFVVNTPTAAWTLSNPTNLSEGKTLTYEVIHGATVYSVTPGSAFKFGDDVPSYTPTASSANKRDFITAKVRGSNVYVVAVSYAY